MRRSSLFNSGVRVPGRHSTFSLFRLAAAFVLTLVVLVCSAPLSSAQHGALSAPADLQRLVQTAATIVRGHVVSAVVEPHPQFANLQTVVVTLSVSKVLKGDAGATFTFRQFVWEPQDVETAAGYRKSPELLLFLNPNSQYGLTSPVGLEQGRFHIVRDAKGNAFASNGRRNAGLFDQLDTKAAEQGIALSPQARALAAKPSGGVPLAALEDAVSALARAQR